MRLCEIEGCNRKHSGRGLCQLHYHRLIRTGDVGSVNLSRRAPGEVIAALESLIATAGDECQFGLYEGRRGMVILNGQNISAPRAVWILAHGDPGDAFVLHTCHQGDRGCMNVNHLYLGDHLQNMADRMAVGHYARGEDNVVSKLTEAQVRDIRARRAAGETLQSIGDRYGVHLSTIHLIDKRKTWAELDD